MKTKNLLCLLAALVLPTGVLPAASLAGPKGGRILTAAAPHAEFWVDARRHVVISFYDADLRPVTASDQVVVATVEAPSGKVKLEFAVNDGALVSTAPLPEGEGYRVVVQIRSDAAARPTNYRVDFHDETCGECNRAEYACTCEAAGHEGHAH